MLPRRAKDTEDTDPSTPDALRGADTDPGLGPPPPASGTTAARRTAPPPRPASAPPQGYASAPPPAYVPPQGYASAPPPAYVPPQGYASAPPPGSAPGQPTPTPAAVSAFAPVGPKKDSVELLLEGMPAQPPERSKTMPQSAGQASASYHVEHSLRPAHTSPDALEPSVVVERTVQPKTLRIDRDLIEAAMAQHEALRQAQEAPPGAPRAGGLTLGLRIAIATVAGLAVVLGIFLAVRPSDSRSQAATPANAAASPVPAPGPAASGPTPAVTATADTTAPAAAAPPSETAAATVESPSSTPAPPAAVASGGSRAPASTGASPAAPSPAKPRARASSSPASQGGDLGEFKSAFH